MPYIRKCTYAYIHIYIYARAYMYVGTVDG